MAPSFHPRAPSRAMRSNRQSPGSFPSSLTKEVSSFQRCGCRKPCPCRSSGMLILVGDAAEAVTSTDVQVHDRVWTSDRFRQWLQGSGVRDAGVGAVLVVVLFVLV